MIEEMAIKKDAPKLDLDRIEDAVEDLCNAFKNGELPNSFENDYYFNVKQLKKINAK